MPHREGRPRRNGEGPQSLHRDALVGGALKSGSLRATLDVAATTVDARGFDSEASWNAVSASARARLSCQPHAEAIQVEHLVAKDHRDCETGDLAGGDEMLRQPLQVLGRAFVTVSRVARGIGPLIVCCTGVVIAGSPPKPVL